MQSSIRIQTKDFRSLPPEAQEDLRRKAINAMQAGVSPKDAALLFGVSRQAISKWRSLFRNSGVNGLVAKTRGAPRKDGPLLAWQTRRLLEILAMGFPEERGISGHWLWSKQAVEALIRHEFKMELSSTSIMRLLDRCGILGKSMRRQHQVEGGLKDEYLSMNCMLAKEKFQLVQVEISRFPLSISSEEAVERGERKSDSRLNQSLFTAICGNGQSFFKIIPAPTTVDILLELGERLVRQKKRNLILVSACKEINQFKELLESCQGMKQIGWAFIPNSSR